MASDDLADPVGVTFWAIVAGSYTEDDLRDLDVLTWEMNREMIRRALTDADRERAPIDAERRAAELRWAEITLFVVFSPLWIAAALAYLTVEFARYGWNLADDLTERLN